MPLLWLLLDNPLLKFRVVSSKLRLRARVNSTPVEGMRNMVRRDLTLSMRRMKHMEGCK